MREVDYAPPAAGSSDARSGARAGASRARPSARPTAGRPARPSASRSGPRGRGRARRAVQHHVEGVLAPGDGLARAARSGKAATACRSARRASPKSSLAWSHAAGDVSAGPGQPSSSGSVCDVPRPPAGAAPRSRRPSRAAAAPRRSGAPAIGRAAACGRADAPPAGRGATGTATRRRPRRTAAAGPRSGPFRSWRPPPCGTQLGADTAASLHRSVVLRPATRRTAPAGRIRPHGRHAADDRRRGRRRASRWPRGSRRASRSSSCWSGASATGPRPRAATAR